MPMWKAPRALTAAALCLGLAGAAPAQVVISQFDGSSGLNGSVYDHDFIELFNNGSTPVSLDGWSLQIFSDFSGPDIPTATEWETVVPLSGTILPGQYFLVSPSRQRGSGATTQTPLPEPDLYGPNYINSVMATNANAIALVRTTARIPDGECPIGHPVFGPLLVDFARNGHPNANCIQGTPPPATTGNTNTAVVRNGQGCADTNNDGADLTSGLVPAPRNGRVNAFVAASFNAEDITTGTPASLRITASRGTATCNPITGALTSVTADLSAFGLSASQPLNDNGDNGDVTAGDGVFTYDPTIPAAQAPGRYSVPVTATDGTTTLTVASVLRVLPPPPANDTCATATDVSAVLTGGPVVASVNPTVATSDGVDAGSCNGDSEVKFSVWYKITTGAGHTGALRVVESGPEDVVYSVHASCGGASTLCVSRDEMAFALTPGTTMWIQVGRETNNLALPQAPYELVFDYVTAPANDLPCGAATIGSFPFAARPVAAAYTAETFNIGCDNSANPGARHGAWYTFTPAADGVLEVFDNSANSVNYVLFMGASCGTIAEQLCRDEGSVGSSALVHERSGPLRAGVQYWLLVSYDLGGTNNPSTLYDFVLDLLPAAAGDTCSTAVVIPNDPIPATLSVDGRNATPDFGGNSGCTAVATSVSSSGVWFKFTAGPTQAGVLHITETTSRDMAFWSFTGPGCASLTPVSCAPFATDDDIYAVVRPGQTYWILAALSSTVTVTAPYQFTLEFLPIPANDTPCTATLVTSSLSDPAVGPAATADIDISCNYTTNPPQTVTGYGVWYRFSPATPKQLYVEDHVTDVLAFGLFTGPDCDHLTEVGCRQGSNADLFDNNAAWFNLQGGANYWLLVGKISNDPPFTAYDIDVELTDALGACCAGSGCVITTQAACGGTWRGPFTYCGDTPQFEDAAPNAIPEATAAGGPGVLTRTITAAGDGTVSDLKVLIDITHARVGDLIFKLTGPGGATIELMRRPDDDNDPTNAVCPNFNDQARLADINGVYIFDDQAYTPYGPDINTAVRYFDTSNAPLLPSDHYRPALCDLTIPNINAVMAGQPIAGVWTLEVSDNDVGSVGTLRRWGLIINGGLNPPCPACVGDFNGVGGVELLDIFAFLNAWFAGCTGPGPAPCVKSADVNGMNGVDLLDIFFFLNHWFQGC